MSVIIFDKHPGPTSSQAVRHVREVISKIIEVKKIGHTGTLDPNVSGVLPILINKATRFAQYLLNADKEYVAVVKFHAPVDEHLLIKTLKRFTGPIYQKPPVRSKASRRLRIRHVYAFELLELHEREAIIKWRVESGTYIRKLIRDIGLYMGINAHMAELRRIRTGVLTEDEALNLLEIKCLVEKIPEDESLRNILFRPIDYALRHLPKVSVKYLAGKAFTHGHPIYVPGIVEFDAFKEGDRVRVYYEGEFLGVGVAAIGSEELNNISKGVVIRPETVYKKLIRAVF